MRTVADSHRSPLRRTADARCPSAQPHAPVPTVVHPDQDDASVREAPDRSLGTMRQPGPSAAARVTR
ncbi:hypothetical protein [Streptomyces clavuligerus]|nr:hypothetical protein [Streptomyces clavuligerus]WDN54496.1 hypothetical protein LL058_23105 [Streptomyces clavuligerus]